ncbi:MAG: hypothetical protein JWL76_1340 [Thermoleophilia bacterium]|nr:hypothetical protein [Thermoleophilia bacterium]
MQTMPHTPAHAQHIPDGWSFPTLTAATPPHAAQPLPVTGGGAAPSTVTRVRWGRVLPLFAGIALIAFGIWSVTNDSPSTAARDRTVSGGGGSDVDISRSVGADDAGIGDDATGVDSSGGASDTSFGHDATKTPATSAAPAVTPAAGSAARSGTGTVRGGGGGTTARATGARAGRTARTGRTGRTARRGAVAARTFAPGTASAAATAPRTRTGGGAPAGELPMTGLETWIAAILGVLLLGIGICVHVSAVRIAATAMLYRRGILLRPTEWELLSQRDGLARVRVVVSDLLHRLLEEPARGSDFVSARNAI